MSRMITLPGLVLLLGCSGAKATLEQNHATRLTAISNSTEKHRQLLDAHNEVRAEVKAPPLTWSAAAESQAQRWAGVLARRCDIEHSQGSGFGENLFMGTLGFYDELDGIKAWEEEKRDYAGQPLSRSLALRVGHYTQMVWPTTRELGCATSVCNNNMILVCNYYPPGNYLGESAY
ncbi:pathogenesis-related protein 1 [Oceanisphaera litoralis]|nr:pathogenesis-related protein 1 [Oceanisphaera litoralis]